VRVLGAFFAILMAAASVQAGPWVLPPASYKYAAIARCADPAAAAIRPNEARYEICADQMALFIAALEKARAVNRLLIVDFGATWCPWCRSLQGQWPTPALLGHKSANLDFATTFDVLKVGISAIDGGRRVDIPSGHAVLDHVLAATGGTKLRSVPFLAVIDPNDMAKAIGRNLDDFELESAGKHDPAFVRAYLTEAHAFMRKGATAPSEPGWLRKKFNRGWMRLFGG
jgi:thiol-disulfide isomerase/thioredoxin